MVGSTSGAQGWVQYDETQVRVYALADPAPFRRNQPTIAKIVQSALGAKTLSDASVDISEASAWLAYEAPGEVWTRSHPMLPSRRDAQRVAREALSKLERECSPASDSWRKSVGTASLLPPVRELKEAVLAAVPRPDGSSWDHWLYRCQPQLVLDGAGKTRALVCSAQVEVRVGHLGQVISLRSRWHPISGQTKYAPIVPFVAPPSEQGDTSSSEAAPTVQYVLDGDGSPQYYLAPYHARQEDHVLAMYSATSWSLTVDIGRVRQGSSSMTLVALAEGGSGDYLYNWGAWSKAGLGPFVTLGSGTPISSSQSGVASQMEFPNDAYIVAINVLDRATGAFKHHRQTIAACPISSPDDRMLVS